MSKVKYIKVKGVDPTKRGHYFIKTKNSSFLKGDYFHSKDKIWEKTHKKDVEFWLEPIPDREEEMREMLEKVLKINHHHNFNGHLINEQIEQLLNELKQ